MKKSGAQTVLLINPDNPSGHFIEKKDVLFLLDELEDLGARLIFDESFIDFADKEKRYTLLDDKVLSLFPNLIVIKSISKSYGVPGLRLGVLATGDTAYSSRIRKKVAIWNINCFGENFLQIVDKYKKAYADACDSIGMEREYFAAELQKLPGVHVYPSQANYVLCKLESGVNAGELGVKLLEEHNIFIKDLSSKRGFEDGQYMRLAIRDRHDNTVLLQALRAQLS